MSVPALYSEVCKSINVLVAIRWVAMAWSLVQEETVRKCFRKAGVIESDLTVVACDEQDLFLAAGHEACPVKNEEYINEEYINGEGSLPVCDGPDDSNWDSSFFTQLSQRARGRR